MPENRIEGFLSLEEAGEQLQHVSTLINDSIKDGTITKFSFDIRKEGIDSLMTLIAKYMLIKKYKEKI